MNIDTIDDSILKGFNYKIKTKDIKINDKSYEIIYSYTNTLATAAEKLFKDQTNDIDNIGVSYRAYCASGLSSRNCSQLKEDYLYKTFLS